MAQSGSEMAFAEDIDRERDLQERWLAHEGMQILSKITAPHAAVLQMTQRAVSTALTT